MIRVERWVVLAALLSCCGGAPDKPPQHPARREEQAASSVVAQLKACPPDALPALVDRLARPDIEAAINELEPGSAAHVLARLRLGRLLAHLGRTQEAIVALKAGRKTPGGGMALEAELARLEARRTMRPRTIGVLLPLSGEYGDIGQAAMAGIQLALADREGIELVVRDTQADADVARHAVTEMVTKAGVAAIIGPIGSLESQAAAIVAERLAVPIMTLSAEKGLTRIGPFVFRHRLTRGAQARALADYAIRRMGLSHFAILYPRSDHGREMMHDFWTAVESYGGEVRAASSYDAHTRSFNEPIRKLVGRFHLEAREKSAHWATVNRKLDDPAMHVAPVLDFEAIFLPDTGERVSMILPFLVHWDIPLRTHPELDSATLAPQYGGVPPQLVQVLGTSGLNDWRFAERTGELAHNAVFVDAFVPDSTSGRAFAKSFTKQTGHPPPPVAAHAFDAANLVSDAVVLAKDRDAVRRNLLQVADYEGVVGKTRIMGDGDVELHLHVLTIDPELGITGRQAERLAPEP